MRAAIFLAGISEHPGGGERFFADVYDYYQQNPKPGLEVFFFADQLTVDYLKALNRLSDYSRIVILSNLNNRLKNYLEPWEFWRKLRANNIDIVHAAVYGVHYLPRLKFLSRRSKSRRPFIVVNIENLNVGLYYNDAVKNKAMGLQRKYGPLFSEVKMDAIYCWYKSFEVLNKKQHILPAHVKVGIARYCFADTSRFAPSPQKENIIVFAGRMIEGKRPGLFIDAMALIRKKYPEIFATWQFRIYGDGPLAELIDRQIVSQGLSDTMNRNYVSNLAPVYAISKCFVSTQDDENFTSLAMLEAMAAGNAIIARNVGQTDYFVRDGKNGILINSDSPNELAEAIVSYIKSPERHASMAKESVKIAREEHTVGNFTADLESFWKSVCGTH